MAADSSNLTGVAIVARIRVPGILPLAAKAKEMRLTSLGDSAIGGEFAKGSWSSAYGMPRSGRVPQSKAVSLGCTWSRGFCH